MTLQGFLKGKHKKPMLSQSFCNAKQMAPAHLERLHISNMSDGFAEACPGDILSTKMVIADDKSSGSFMHENRPKLHALTVPWWGDRKYQGLCDDFTNDPDFLPALESSYTVSSLGSVIGVEAELETIWSAEDIVHVQQNVRPANASPYTSESAYTPKSPVLSSISWVSFEGFMPPDISMDIDRSVSESDSSARLADVVEKFDSTADEFYALTDSAIHPAPSKTAVLTCTGFLNVKTVEPEVDLVTPDPVASESNEIALMGFGHLKAATTYGLPVIFGNPVIPPLTITKKSAPVMGPTPVLSLSKSSSLRKYLREEGKKLAMNAIKDEPLPDMPETPPRFKMPRATAFKAPIVAFSKFESLHKYLRAKNNKLDVNDGPLPNMPETPRSFKLPLTTALVAPLVAHSSSGSLRKYLRAEGKKLAMHALSDEPYPEMPETPPRFKNRIVKAISPVSSAKVVAHDLTGHRGGVKRLLDDLQESDSISLSATEDIFGPKQPYLVPLVNSLDFPVIDFNISNIIHPASSTTQLEVVKKLTQCG